eukprot:GCRY01002476.1.p1 GENE.GCRY01002476.1~~GCRY01002476.1.p1  ORF type:complete len:308 (+),score=37.35 GCRY01002476.1:127-1050(+)
MMLKHPLLSILPESAIQQFVDCGITTVEKVMFSDVSLLSEQSHVPEKILSEIIKALLVQNTASVQRASDLWHQFSARVGLFSTGNKLIDQLLCEGLRTGEIVEFFGPSCSGKTQLIHSILAETVRATPSTVLHLDTTNGFSPEFMLQVLNSFSDIPVKEEVLIEQLQRIHVVKLRNIFQTLNYLHSLITGLSCNRNFFAAVRILTVDSIFCLLSPILGPDPHGHTLMMILASYLKYIARVHDIAVVLTNNVAILPGSRSTRSPALHQRPALGDSWTPIPTVSIGLTRTTASESYRPYIQHSPRQPSL